MSFRAKFPSRCALCNVRIEVDDEIEIVEVLGERKPAHEDCAENLQTARDEQASLDQEARWVHARVCPKCNLQHAGDCW